MRSPRYKDMTGQNIGGIEVLGPFDGYLNTAGQKMWKCRCYCGTEFTTSGHKLRKGLTKSCGCRVRTKINERP